MAWWNAHFSGPPPSDLLALSSAGHSGGGIAGVIPGHWVDDGHGGGHTVAPVVIQRDQTPASLLGASLTPVSSQPTLSGRGSWTPLRYPPVPVSPN
jgi:hypothetical protein